MPDLSILIKAKLDEALSTQEITKQLDKISKNLDISIGIDSKGIDKLQSQINKLQKEVNAQAKNLRVVNDQESINNINNIDNKTKQLFTSVEKAREAYSKIGQVKIESVLDPVTKEVNGFNLSVEKGQGLIEKLKFELVSLGDSNHAFELIDVKEIDNTAKIAEQQLQKIHQTRQKIAKQEEANIQKRHNLEREYEQWWLKALSQREAKEAQVRERVLAEEQKIRAALEKREQQQKEINEKLEHQLNLFKQRAQIDATNLQRRFSGQFDETELNNWLNNVNKLNKDTPNLRNNMDNLGMEFRRISSEVRTANSHVLGFREALATAFQRVPIWGISTGVIYGSIRALKDMTQQIIEVDTALTSLARVTDMTDEGLQNFLQEAIQLSDDLSNKLSDVLTIAEEFSRLGFEENELIDITQTAQVLQNISDLDAKETVDALTSAMLNFNIAGEDSLRISDALNEVDNNFAVTTQTLATGLQKSASTAQTFGVEMEELLGYITAIGSTTRESGSQIGRLIADVKSLLIDLEVLT